MALTDNGQNSTQPLSFRSFANILKVESKHNTYIVSKTRLPPPPLENKYIIKIMVDALPVPKTLEAQLSKCKSVREPTHYKSREKTPAVRYAVCKSPP
jgi:hypothetical protein